MNVKFSFGGCSFAAGIISASAISGAISGYWMLVTPALLISLEIKGMPYMKITYKTEEGWKIIKDRY